MHVICLTDLHLNLNLATVAADVGVTYETFRKQFRTAVGVAPGRYRLIRCIDTACTMLLHTDLNVKAIAARASFGDEFQFSHSFKQITGPPPPTFRRQLPQSRSTLM